MHRIVVVIAVVLAAIGLTAAQLNFSTGWGKRAPNANNIASPADNCKTSMDTVIMLYKIIQSEAQKLVDCERFEK